MKALRLGVLALAFSQSALAARIYEAKENFDLESLEGEVKIIDSIPQLDIIVTVDQVDNRNLNDLGEMQTVGIIEPLAAPPKKLWGLRTIEAEQAWAFTQGEGVLVAVSDTGIDLDHPDLAQNIWSNPKEIADNGIDDDGNGYVDDVHGWDFVKKKPALKDHHYHGTHVAGTIAASFQHKIPGVAPRAKLMNVPFLNSSGSGTEVDGAKTIIYAADNGAKIINCSWGGTGKSDVIEKAIEYAAQKGVLVVTAAGNDGMNTDRKTHFPSGANVDNIVSVGASTSSNSRASFSNTGKVSVDLAAPGLNIYSAAPASKGRASYQSLSGTSMASPHVAGVAALIWSVRPKLTYKDVKTILMETAQPSKAWASRSVSGGILNAKGAVSRAYTW